LLHETKTYITKKYHRCSNLGSLVPGTGTKTCIELVSIHGSKLILYCCYVLETKPIFIAVVCMRFFLETDSEYVIIQKKLTIGPGNVVLNLHWKNIQLTVQET
jgi:hypothetical protein